MAFRTLEFSYIKRYLIVDRSESVTTALEIIDQGIPITPLSRMRPLLLNLWYGPISDPTDQFIDVYIAAIDADNMPDQSSVDEQAVWVARQVWRTVGTPATVVQTMIHEQVMLLGHPLIINIGLGTRHQNYRLALLAIADQALTYAFVGHIDVEITIIRRIWSGEDNPATDMSFEEFYGGDQ